MPLTPVVERPSTPVPRPQTPPPLHQDDHHAYPYELLMSPPPRRSHGLPFSFQSGTTALRVIEQPGEGKGKDALLQDGYQAEDTYIYRGRGAGSGEYVTADTILNPPLTPSRADGGGPGPQTGAHRRFQRSGVVPTSQPQMILNRRRRPRNRRDAVRIRPNYGQTDGCDDGAVEANVESKDEGEDETKEPPKKRPKRASSADKAAPAPEDATAMPPPKRQRTEGASGVAGTSGMGRSTVASRMVWDPSEGDDEIVVRLLRERDRRDAETVAERRRMRAEVATWFDSGVDDEPPPGPPLVFSDPSAYTFSSSQFGSGNVQAMYERDEGPTAAGDRAADDAARGAGN